MDVHTAALLAVLQGELHAAVQVLQAGDAGEVDGAQPQLLHSDSSPLLRPDVRLHFSRTDFLAY